MMWPVSCARMLVTKPSASCIRNDRRARDRARSSALVTSVSVAVVSAALMVSGCVTGVELVAAGEEGVVRVNDASCACAVAANESAARTSRAHFSMRGRRLLDSTREIYQSAHNALTRASRSLAPTASKQ